MSDPKYEEVRDMHGKFASPVFHPEDGSFGLIVGTTEVCRKPDSGRMLIFDMAEAINMVQEIVVKETVERCAKIADDADRLAEALVRIRDCDWTIGRGDRMDPVRDIARDALIAHEALKGKT